MGDIIELYEMYKELTERIEILEEKCLELETDTEETEEDEDDDI